ncbi:CidA/LrgA family protein [Cohnella lubricantis]|uniref:CidA/LrgA family protein n=1 Tax=Cohnella lubricantis TaxID=2163172 RepID=A0A841TCH3_9BACL|nr:CidA/LrgA family protein [Cohnella lubricantis]MBB6676940.1 CidA/LrgA family protein [Cohnella lubricantis]MBP2118344.1 holin-like protein [Cohnella lubricantis]
MRKWGITACQVVFYIVVARIADALVDWLRLPIPGSILGIAMLFALLKLGWIRLSWIDRGSKWLLGEMLLFFIPAAVGIVNYGSLVASSGWQIAITIIVSTAAVMACAGWIGERIAARAVDGAGAAIGSGAANDARTANAAIAASGAIAANRIAANGANPAKAAGSEGKVGA